MAVRKHALVVSGDRAWDDEKAIAKQLAGYPNGTFLIHGYAAGADTLARRVAKSGTVGKFTVVDVEYLGWAGKAGGPIRNDKMLELLRGLRKLGYDCTVILFHDDLEGRSRGTKDMRDRAKRSGFRTRHVKHKIPREALDG